jgi:hypothetical protein
VAKRLDVSAKLNDANKNHGGDQVCQEERPDAGPLSATMPCDGSETSGADCAGGLGRPRSLCRMCQEKRGREDEGKTSRRAEPG